MRQSEIRGYAIRYLDNVDKNNGKCKYGFLAGLVREASTKNNALQIYKKDILHEATRIVAKQRTVSQQLSGTTKECTINNEPLDIDDPRVDDLQVTVRTNIIDNAVPNPQPPPLLPGGEVKVNETSVITTEYYFLYRMGATVPKTVTHVQLHSSVTKLIVGRDNYQLFGHCTALVKVELNNGLQKIGQWAFNGCTSLRHIIIPSSVTTIDVNAFAGCINLVTVVLHEGLETIGRSAFSGCKSLHHIDIPTTVTTIGDHAFTGCAVNPHSN
jgi:hypothetical protein